MTQSPIARVAVVGTGVIGASWVAQFLAAGLDVIATDPQADAEERLRSAVAEHWPVLERIGLAAGASIDRMTFVDDASRAVEHADFVQENGPEREDVKAALFAVLDEASRPDVVIASSSSGLPPSTIQAACRVHPERVLVGHPFNPPHLVPLVEVVGGIATTEAAIETAMAFYSGIGKRPVLPPLLSEEWDVEKRVCLGNTPLLWSHTEAARALYNLHTARIRKRFGAPGVAVYNVSRYVRIRFQRRPGPNAVASSQSTPW